jgi:hypothetical protein
MLDGSVARGAIGVILESSFFMASYSVAGHTRAALPAPMKAT